MRFRTLALVPLAAAAATAAVALSADPATGDRVLHVAQLLAKALAAAGCLAAALAFERGHPLRTAWALHAAGYALLAARGIPPVAALSPQVAPVAIFLANVLNPAATFLLVRTWDRAGLAPATAGRRRGTLMALAFAASLCLAGPALASALRGAATGPGELLLVLSALGDVVEFTLLAPLLLIALALRGGVLAWPWGLIAGGMLSWLGFDLLGAVADRLWAPLPASAAAEAFRIAACLLFGAAGIAQWLVVRPAPARASAVEA